MPTYFDTCAHTHIDATTAVTVAATDTFVPNKLVSNFNIFRAKPFVVMVTSCAQCSRLCNTRRFRVCHISIDRRNEERKKKQTVDKEEKTSNVCALRICIICSSVMSTNKTWHRHSLVPHIFLGSSLLPPFFLVRAISVFPSFSIYHRRVGDRENKSFHTPHATPFLICWRCDAATAAAAAMYEHGQCEY